MKTTVLAIAATLIASTSAFANGGLYNVNDAPENYEARLTQSIDFEPTNSVTSAPAFASGGLFDVNDAPENYEARLTQFIDFEPTASNIAASDGFIDLQYEPKNNGALFD